MDSVVGHMDAHTSIPVNFHLNSPARCVWPFTPFQQGVSVAREPIVPLEFALVAFVLMLTTVLLVTDAVQAITNAAALGRHVHARNKGALVTGVQRQARLSPLITLKMNTCARRVIWNAWNPTGASH